jgi:hypothetical protein
MFRTTGTSMKQKSGVQMNHNHSNHKIPSFKRRRCIFMLLYTFVMLCFMSGIADLILLIKSIILQKVSYINHQHPHSYHQYNHPHHTGSRMTKTHENNHHNNHNYTKDVAISIAAMERSKEAQKHIQPPNSIPQQQSGRCAINFFGLPRAFESLVLPSIIKNIILPNRNCDYYVHYYYMTQELQGRSGNGGSIDPTAILLLKNAVHKVSKERGETVLPIVEFVYNTEADFWNQYTDLINKIRTTKIHGKHYYFPWKAKTYRHPVTTDNIVKMWHSIQSSYQLMEKMAQQKYINYNTVAMLRSDVVYVTPININDIPVVVKSNEKQHNSHQYQLPPVTVPNFGKHPVSDRIIYGPKEAVRIWATERFTNLERHVDFIYKNDPGWGMHSERFVNYTLFPLIQNITSIYLHPTICFFRARADETVWVSDCSGTSSDVAAPSVMDNLKKIGTLRTVVQDAIGRSCSGQKPIQLTKSVRSLDCSTTTTTTATTNVKLSK